MPEYGEGTFTDKARSTSGEVAGLSSRLGRVRIPHGLFNFPLGGVTEAHRSDTAKAMVQLHPRRLKEIDMQREHRSKRGHTLDRGRGVTAASLAFNQAGVGSNPSDPNDTRACSSTVRAGLL